MLDIRFIRENPELVKQAAKYKGYEVSIDRLLQLDGERRNVIASVEGLRQQRNETAAQMKSAGKPDESVITKGRQIKEQLTAEEDRLKSLEADYLTELKKVPNLPLAHVPLGASEDDNVVSKTVGEPTKFDFEPKNHWEIAENKGWIDKERAAKVAGSRFAYIKGDLVRLQFAIIQYVLDVLGSTEALQNIASRENLNVSTKPFTPVLPPYFIKTELYDAMDRLEPRDERYKLEDEDLWLQGSAEHVLGSMHAGEILDQTDLPLRYVGYATSFRREAGTYGKDMEGIIRMHQFDKLELESITGSAQGTDEHRFFIAIQEYMLEQLNLPYRVLTKCTADIGKPNASGVDMEVWLPGQNKYRETHTADYMTDYQARRLQTRVRTENGELELAHTNDATAFALGRIMVAIIENYQTADGDVRIPEVLKSYIGTLEKI